MVLEDIRYQLDQFSIFDDVRLSIEINNKKGVIYYNAGVIIGASFDDKKNIDVFRELKDLEGQISINVSIGEPMPDGIDEDKIDNKSLDEILELINNPEAVSSDNDNDNDNYDLNKNLQDDLSSFNYEVSNEAITAIGENLSQITGVEGVIALKSSGEVIYSKDIEDTDFESADTLFLFNQSKDLGGIFSFQDLNSVICEANNNYRKIIINNKNIIYSLIVSSSVQALKTQTEAVRLLES
ncbi:MAG: hypothetical protein EVG15_03910 [Candidatus Acididesulfobacter diazotrophicus]|jgi:hypothetical protein|uniref:Roadblock/LC7 domain-containing protein n=1 Tax=Candidatus Acididesulfobacter diazotrophicus TaxID=2597226 RepID=A0A519BNW6_9DELT|nr:MAG: hypothetical protein EVG15_03910 [Candidatus Acididesulfobacter diazotrophicus]